MKIFTNIRNWFKSFFKEKSDLEIIKNYAIGCHKKVNHKYDGKPYKVHLQMVYDYARRYSYLIPTGDLFYVYASCWCHDLIEDTRETYNDVKLITGYNVANIVYALSNEKGKNRKDRANAKYYQGIRETEFADFVKICDRLANAKYSKKTGSKMLELYRLENKFFVKELYSDKYIVMFDELSNILN